MPCRPDGSPIIPEACRLPAEHEAHPPDEYRAIWEYAATGKIKARIAYLPRHILRRVREQNGISRAKLQIMPMLRFRLTDDTGRGTIAEE